MLLEVGGENLAAVPEVVTLDSRLVSLAVRSPRVNLPTKRCARRAAQIAFARRAGCSRCGIRLLGLEVVIGLLEHGIVEILILIRRHLCLSILPIFIWLLRILLS